MHTYTFCMPYRRYMSVAQGPEREVVSGRPFRSRLRCARLQQDIISLRLSLLLYNRHGPFLATRQARVSGGERLMYARFVRDFLLLVSPISFPPMFISFHRSPSH